MIQSWGAAGEKNII